MVSQYEDTIVALITTMGSIVVAILAGCLSAVGILLKQNYDIRARVDRIEEQYGETIALLNALGRWIRAGAPPEATPRISATLSAQVPDWPDQWIDPDDIRP